MRVLTIVDGMGPPLARGTRVIYEHLVELAKRGIQHHVLTLVDFRMDPDWQAWAAQEQRRSGITFHAVQVPALLRFHALHMVTSRIQYLREAIRLHRTHGFDVIHAYSSSQVMLMHSALISHRTGVPIIHTLCVYNNRWWNPTGWQHGIRRIAKVICSTQRLAGELIAQGFPRDKVLCMPLGVNCQTFHPDATSRVETRQVFGWPLDRPVLLYLGPLVRSKGAGVLASALPSVFEKTSAVCMFACQPGPRWRDVTVAAQVRALCDRYPDRCRIQEGFHPVERLLQASDVVVLPLLTAHGTLLPPQTLLEAMASATVVVASAVYGIDDWIHDGSTGILVPPGDSQALARRLTEILLDITAAARLGVQARQFVQTWDLVDVTSRLHQLYSELSNHAVPVAV